MAAMLATLGAQATASSRSRTGSPPTRTWRSCITKLPDGPASRGGVVRRPDRPPAVRRRFAVRRCGRTFPTRCGADDTLGDEVEDSGALAAVVDATPGVRPILYTRSLVVFERLPAPPRGALCARTSASSPSRTCGSSRSRASSTGDCGNPASAVRHCRHVVRVGVPAPPRRPWRATLPPRRRASSGATARGEGGEVRDARAGARSSEEAASSSSTRRRSRTRSSAFAPSGHLETALRQRARKRGGEGRGEGRGEGLHELGVGEALAAPRL